MKIIQYLIVVFCSSLLYFQAAQVQGQTQKIGYVDVERVLSSMAEFKQMQQALLTHRDKLAQQLMVRQSYAEQKFAEYQEKMKQGGSMTPEEQQAKENELKKLQQEIEEFQATAEKSIMRKQNELLAPVSAKVQSAIEALAASEGYAYIFNKSATSNGMVMNPLLHAPKENDLTEKVAKKLNITLVQPDTGTEETEGSEH